MEKAKVTAFHERLRDWYAAYGRHDLPWRNTSDPYHIYVSEVMLQQTQVKTVLERYYFPFLERFPSIGALAQAQEQEVLKAWEGLGYYNRALHLHKAAKLLHEARQNSLPSDVEKLLALPGIGRNTAHAVASFAYHSPVPVMEANVKRLLHRIFAWEKAGPEQLWEAAFALLDEANPFDYNQAMMDIGSLVCTKTAPDCPNCPANVLCKGQSAPERYPAKITKKETPVRRKHIVVFVNSRSEYFLSTRRTRFLNGLYGFPEFEPDEQVTFLGEVYSLAPYQKIGHVTQTYSHFTLEAEVFLLSVKKPASGDGWVRFELLDELAVSRADSKVIALLADAQHYSLISPASRK